MFNTTIKGSEPATASNLPNGTSKSQSKLDKINKWFVTPLSSFREHECFIILMVCLPLYEKYLRARGHIKATENFSKGNAVFKIIGKNFGVSSDGAFHFWQIFRNGLCHRAMPKVKKDRNINYKLVRNSVKILEFENNLLTLNPFKFRDFVFDLIIKNISIMKDDEYPFADEYEDNCGV